MNAVELRNVTKTFGPHVAVDELSLDVPPGTIYGFIGPNGSGKTTTLRMIMRIIHPDRGRIAVLGDESHGAAHDRVAYLPEERGLYKQMKVADLLYFDAQLKGHRATRFEIDGWLERMFPDQKARVGDLKVEALSKGMSQKVQYIATVIARPQLVLLDEPFSGLDPVNSRVMKDVVVDIARSGRTVLFSTHIMDQAERMCDRIVIVARGEKVVDGAVADIKREEGSRHVRLTFARDRDKARRVLEDRRLVAEVHDHGASAEVELAEGADGSRLLDALIGAGAGLSHFAVVEPSLESIFISRVGAQAAAAMAAQEPIDA